jgi:hypothetical protein
MNKLELSGLSVMKAGSSWFKLVGVDTDTLPETKGKVVIDFWSPRPIDKRRRAPAGIERERAMLRKRTGPVRLIMLPEDARALKAWFAGLDL